MVELRQCYERQKGNSTMDEIRYIAGTLVGAGVDIGSLDEALKENPHFIACDAGTTDAGPFSLGSGQPAFAREAVKRDLAALLDAGRRAGIPVLIGSAGTAGGEVVPKRWGLSWRPQPQPSNSLPSLPSSAASRSCTIPSQNGAALPPAS